MAVNTSKPEVEIIKHWTDNPAVIIASNRGMANVIHAQIEADLEAGLITRDEWLVLMEKLMDGLAGAGELVKKHGPVRTTQMPGRNEPCWCKSSKKYKNCCG